MRKHGKKQCPGRRRGERDRPKPPVPTAEGDLPGQESPDHPKLPWSSEQCDWLLIWLGSHLAENLRIIVVPPPPPPRPHPAYLRSNKLCV